MLIAAILTPFLCAILLAFTGKNFGVKIGYYVLPIPVLVFGYFACQIPAVVMGNGTSVFCAWLPQWGINFSLGLNGLSLLFALLISGVGVLVFWYSIGYLHSTERLVNFYCFLLIFMGAMLGVVTAQNLMMIYLFWELTSFSSFLLIGFWYEQERPRYGAQKALFLTVIGGFCMFAAFILLYQLTGTMEISGLLAQKQVIAASKLYPAITLLVLLGAFAKSAQAPFHIWLPDAMEAPTPISCYLHSATMVNAGIYLIALLSGVLGGTRLWFGVVFAVGICSLIWGAFRALKQTDLKAILANSTISQLGLIVALLGFGSEGAIVAALFHLFNHSAFKGSLFLVTGMVDHACGTRDIRRLRGLAKAMPVTAVFAACGCLAMAGLPPFNGFLSKELFFSGAIEAVSGNLAFLGPFAWLAPVLAVLGSIFTFVYCLVILCKVFFGGPIPEDLPQKPHEPGKLMLLPTGLLASLTLLVAFFPNVLAKYLLEPAVATVVGHPVGIHIAFWHGFNLPLAMTLVVIGCGLLLFWRLEGLRRVIFSLPKLLSANDFYDWLIPHNGLTHGAGLLTDFYMTKRLQDYVALSTGFFVLITAGVMLGKNALVLDLSDMAPVSVFEVVWALAIVAAAIAVVKSQRRIPAIFSLGIIGYSVSFFFVIFRAPDLALTQLLVETISLVLFFLAFRYLPKLFADKPQTRRRKGVNLAIAVLTGVVVTLITLIGVSNRLSPSIADYYVANAKTLGGGNNIVNVILVDFRGLDTMGEISVIALASIGVFILISLAVTKPRSGDGKGGE